MELLVKKEINKLYYLKVRYGGGNGWDSQKTFVRVSYKKKNGSLGSKMYCSESGSAILFDSYEKAKELKDKYNVDYEEVAELKMKKYYKDGNLVFWNKKAYLAELEINGVRCYEIRRI